MTLTKVCAVFGASVLLSISSFAFANSALSDLRQCLDQNMAEERAKDRPSVDALLSACAKQYRVVANQLHPSLRDQALHDIRHQIKVELDK